MAPESTYLVTRLRQAADRVALARAQIDQVGLLLDEVIAGLEEAPPAPTGHTGADEGILSELSGLVEELLAPLFDRIKEAVR